MGRRKQDVSIYQIARESGLSASTVSRAINRRAGVGEASRKKVEILLKKYSFTPNYPSSRAARIAIALPHANFDNYVAMAVQGVLSYTSINGMNANIIVRGDAAKESILEMARDQQCNGVIALLFEGLSAECRELAASELPCVFIDTPAIPGNAGFIDNDSYSGAKEAAKHLIALGHRTIGFLNNIDRHVNHLQRLNGYNDALKEAGITPAPAWMQTNLPYDSGSESVRALLCRVPGMTAVMAVDDKLALGAMSAIQQDGLKIPEDISVTGFDNFPDSALWMPPLTTVDHPIRQAAALAAEAIGNCLKKPGSWVPPMIMLPTKLLVRKSTGPARQKEKSK